MGIHHNERLDFEQRAMDSEDVSIDSLCDQFIANILDFMHCVRILWFNNGVSDIYTGILSFWTLGIDDLSRSAVPVHGLVSIDAFTLLFFQRTNPLGEWVCGFQIQR